MKYSAFAIVLLFTVVACTSAEPRRSSVSASGDPEEIFFEKPTKIKEIDKGSQDSVQPVAFQDRKVAPPKQSDTTGSFDEVGYSSWYGEKYQGKPTASGEPYDRMKMTAAHRTLPMGSLVRVQNLSNNKEAVVRINDRGPFVDGRVIDVSEKAADTLAFKDDGVAKVGIVLMKKGDSLPADNPSKLDDADLEDEHDLLEDNKSAKKPQTTKPVAAQTKSVAKAQEGKGFTVQVGVFQSESRAKKFKEQLEADYGKEVRIANRDGNFVVRIGDFADRSEAVELKTKLKTDGIDCFIPKN